jgi:hypothetical protein
MCPDHLIGTHREDDADTAATLRRLRGGVSAALVLDKSIVEYLAGAGLVGGPGFMVNESGSGCCLPPLRTRQSLSLGGGLGDIKAARQVGRPSLTTCSQTNHPAAPGTNQDCDLFVVGEAFETFSLALAFPSGFSAATISDLNRAIVRLQTQQGALDMLESTCARLGLRLGWWRALGGG